MASDANESGGEHGSPENSGREADAPRSARKPTPPAIEPAGFVARLVSDPASPPETTLLSGYPGASDEEGHTRIYFDPELSDYVDVPDGDILHTEAGGGDGGALEPSLVWIRRGAQVLHGPAGGDRQRASFFEGPVFQENFPATVEGTGAGGGGAAEWAAAGFVTQNPAICQVRVACQLQSRPILRTPASLAGCPSVGFCPTDRFGITPRVNPTREILQQTRVFGANDTVADGDTVFAGSDTVAAAAGPRPASAWIGCRPPLRHTQVFAICNPPLACRVRTRPFGPITPQSAAGGCPTDWRVTETVVVNPTPGLRTPGIQTIQQQTGAFGAGDTVYDNDTVYAGNAAAGPVGPTGWLGCRPPQVSVARCPSWVDGCPSAWVCPTDFRITPRVNPTPQLRTPQLQTPVLQTPRVGQTAFGANDTVYDGDTVYAGNAAAGPVGPTGWLGCRPPRVSVARCPSWVDGCPSAWVCPTDFGITPRVNPTPRLRTPQVTLQQQTRVFGAGDTVQAGAYGDIRPTLGFTCTYVGPCAGRGGDTVYAANTGGTLTAYAGSDTVYAGGTDTVYAGSDTVYAGGTDTVYAGSDTVYAGGTDTVYAGSDTVYAGGTDTVYAGSDTVYAGGTDTVYAGSDTVYAGGTDTVYAGSDTVYAGGTDTVYAGAGTLPTPRCPLPTPACPLPTQGCPVPPTPACPLPTPACPIPTQGPPCPPPPTPGCTLGPPCPQTPRCPPPTPACTQGPPCRTRIPQLCQPTPVTPCVPTPAMPCAPSVFRPCGPSVLPPCGPVTLRTLQGPACPNTRFCP